MNTPVEVKKDNIVTEECYLDVTEQNSEFCKKLKIKFNGLDEEWLKQFYDKFKAKKVKITVINAESLVKVCF